VEYANLYIGNTMVGQAVPFQRVPQVNELVFFKDGYHRVSEVGHTWTQANQAIANISLDAGHALLSGPGPFPQGHSFNDASGA